MAESHKNTKRYNWPPCMIFIYHLPLVELLLPHLSCFSDCPCLDLLVKLRYNDWISPAYECILITMFKIHSCVGDTSPL